MALEELNPAEFPSLETTSIRLFRSLVKPYKPQVAPGVFGGHVLAQSSLAAARTTPKEFICHNIHGYFLLPGQRDIPFYYQIEEIRNGSNFLVRQVKVFQNADISRLFSAKSICFIAIVSLKRPTPRGSLNHQRHLPEDFKLTDAFDSLDDHELAPDYDVPHWQDLVKSGKITHNDEYHPIEVRKRNMGNVNDDKKVYERSQIHYFKTNEPISDDQNVHVLVSILQLYLCFFVLFF